MKPVIAQRVTTCYGCKEPILPGSERLSDSIRIKPVKSESNGPAIIRRHFHHRNKEGLSCYDVYAQSIFDKLTEEQRRIRTNNPHGRPPMDLTPYQRITRRKLIRKLSQQIAYYITQGNLDLSKPVYLTEISSRDVRRAEKFAENLKEIFSGLATCGGVPEKYSSFSTGGVE